MQSLTKASDVTVAIPTRDRTDLLAKAIESVLAQTLRVERIVVVDNSTRLAAEVEKLCASYGPGRVEYLAPLRDLSMNENHQRAYAIATTTFACVMQDDDEYRPTFIERAVSALNENPDASFFAVNYAVINSESVQTQDFAWGDFPAGTLSPADFIAHSVQAMSPVHLSAAVYRREAAISTAFYESDTNVSDIGLFLRIACYGPVILVDEPLAAIRVHEQAVSAGKSWSAQSDTLTTTLLPMEWAVKERFLQSPSARLVLGERLNSIRSLGADRVLKRYIKLMKDRHTPFSVRVFCAKEAALLAYRTRRLNRVPTANYS